MPPLTIKARHSRQIARLVLEVIRLPGFIARIIGSFDNQLGSPFSSGHYAKETVPRNETILVGSLVPTFHWGW